MYSRLRRHSLGAVADCRDSDRSRRDLLDEIYYLRDIAGEREQQIVELRAHVEVLQAKLGLLRSGSENPVSRKPPRADEIALDILSPQEPRDATPCLFVDVSELALKAGQTGIQRVVREILCVLLEAPPVGYRVEAVFAMSGQSYRYARTFARGLGTGTVSGGSDTPVHAQQGDVFLGLDHSMDATIAQAATLKAMQQQGVRIWFVCNDILPLLYPEWFPPEVSVTFNTWIETIARVADGIACISRSTEEELKHWLSELPLGRKWPLRTAYFHLGADISIAPIATNVTSEQAAALEHLRTTTTSFLTVGTLEPRKGYAQALDAFELLWEHGEQITWVIVGLPGWMTDIVQRRIRHHDEFGRRLFWFMNASDELLEKLYATCTGLLAPSEGEGFGLPLVEAARQGLPILCRDLPVFREIAGVHASYFASRDAAQLADAIRLWLNERQSGTSPPSTGMPWLTWVQSTKMLLSAVLVDGKCDDDRAPARREDDRE